MKVYNIKDKQNYLREIAILSKNQWGDNTLSETEFNHEIDEKVKKMTNSFDDPSFCILGLLDKDHLIGFISMLPSDSSEINLNPWYAMMYVKSECRGNGYSKILNDALIKEATVRGFRKIYLKSDLINYYEKFGAKYLADLSNGEKLYIIDLV